MQPPSSETPMCQLIWCIFEDLLTCTRSMRFRSTHIHIYLYELSKEHLNAKIAFLSDFDRKHNNYGENWIKTWRRALQRYHMTAICCDFFQFFSYTRNQICREIYPWHNFRWKQNKKYPSCFSSYHANWTKNRLFYSIFCGFVWGFRFIEKVSYRYWALQEFW